MFLYEALENRYISWGFFFFFSAAECSYSATLFLQTAWHHAAVPAFMAVWGILEHRLHLLLGWGGESGCGLVTVRHGSRGRSCPTDGRSGPPLHLFFLLQLIRLQVHVRGGHGALHVWITAASREKQASLPSYRSAKTWMFFFFIEARKHPLNIHVSLLSESDMNLALMDRKCSGQLFGMNVEKRQPQWTSI